MPLARAWRVCLRMTRDSHANAGTLPGAVPWVCRPRMMRQGHAFSIVFVWLLGLAAPAIASTGQDVRSCYAFSDTFPPVAADAPSVDFIDISTIGTPLTLAAATPSSPLPLPF